MIAAYQVIQHENARRCKKEMQKKGSLKKL